MQNGAAKPEEFKAACQAQRPAERIVLPKSGLPVLARRLSPLRVLMHPQVSPEADPLGFARLFVATIQEILVSPRLSLAPGPGEIDPNWLPQEDIDFLVRWGMGLVTAEGEDLGELFRKRAAARAGAHGGDVALPPEPVAQSDGDSGDAR